MLRLRNIRGSQASTFDFSTLNNLIATWSNQSKSVVSCQLVFQQRDKNVPLYFQLRQGYLATRKYDSFKCLSCTELCEPFTFLMENIYVQFDGMVYQQIVLFSTYSRFIFIFLWEGLDVWPSNLNVFTL